jgi:type VI secretion system protein ImpB
VQITYDVEVGDAIQKKELPFIVGVLADLSGQPAQALPKVKDRKFVEIDGDNFNDVLSSYGPRAVFRVDNKLANDGSKINVELTFNHMDDFTPTNVVKQIEPLRKLLEARSRLTDLLGKLDGNDKLDELLQEVVSNTEGLKELKAQTGGGE